MRKQTLGALHLLDDIVRAGLSEEDQQIFKPYVDRWAAVLKGVKVNQTPFYEALGVSNAEMSLPLDLPDEAAPSIGDVDLTDVLGET